MRRHLLLVVVVMCTNGMACSPSGVEKVGVGITAPGGAGISGTVEFTPQDVRARHYFESGKEPPALSDEELITKLYFLNGKIEIGALLLKVSPEKKSKVYNRKDIEILDELKKEFEYRYAMSATHDNIRMKWDQIPWRKPTPEENAEHNRRLREGTSD